MSVKSGRALGLAIALIVLGCETTSAPSDAGARDAITDIEDATPGALTIAIEGTRFPFVGVEACFRLPHDGGLGAPVTIVWGDGASEEVSGESACHTWTLPGPLVMGASIDARGMHAEATQLEHVVFEPASPRPIASSTIAYDAATDRVWVVEPDADVVTVIDASTRARIRTIAVGDRPRTVAVSGATAIVACAGDGTLRLIDTATLTARATVELGAGTAPFGVIVDPRGARAWVTLQASGELASFSIVDPSAVDRLPIGRDPRAIAMRADGAIVVTRWRATNDAAAVVIVDARDPDAPTLVGDTALPREETGDSDTNNAGVLSFLGTLAPSPDGGRFIASALKANVVDGAFRNGVALESQTSARAAFAEISLGAAGTAGRDTFRHRFDDLDYASAAIFSPMGDLLYVAMQGAEVVIAIDAFSFDSVGSIDDVGHAPQGLAIDPSGTMLFVHASLSRSVRVYDVSDLSREPVLAAEIATVELEPLAPLVLRGAQIFHASRDARMSRTRYLSCATCHLDGEGDELVWDFTQRGEGLRNTIPLRGRAGPAHGPMHWSANFDEVQDFEHDIRGGQGGTGFLPDDLFHVGSRDTTLGDPKAGLSPELDALAAYVASLDRFGTSPFRSGEAAWELARARGEALFRDAAIGCATCHSGARYTDSAFTSPGTPLLHDVGTLGPGSGARLGGALSGIDTPTLRGLWSSAPYLHDGSAATLREVLRDRNASDRHGATSALTDASLADLETFLLSLDDAAP